MGEEGDHPGFLRFPATHIGRMSYKARDRGRIRPVPTPGDAGPMQDPSYKRLFSFPRMVEDLLRGFLPGDWLAELDFSTLDKLPAEYVSDELLKRHGDCVWRVRRRGEWLYLLVLLEFQSTDEPRMALRILAYTSLLYQELVRNDALDAGGRLPAVLPIVLYNGEARWRAALEVGELIAPVGPELAPYQPSQRYIVVDERHVGAEDLPASNLMAAVLGLEQGRTPEDLKRVVERLVEWLRDPSDDGLKRAFTDWVWRLAGQFTPGDAEPAPVRTLEGVRMTLEERLAEWPKQWLREGREQGIREVVEQLERVGAEPPPVKTPKDVGMTLEERLAEWPKQWFREGHEQGVREGVERGIEQGLAHERALLRRLAASRFGAETAERLSEVLAGIADPEGLAEVGEWLMRCETGGEFLARVDPAAGGADRRGDCGRSNSRGRSHSRGN